VLMARRRGGERVGEGMGGTRDLTSGPGLPARERRERERGGATDRWGRAVRRGHAQLGHGRRGGEEGAGATWARNGPAKGGEKMFFLFLFLFLISIFYFYFLFISFFFDKQLAK
jgi:hypothetical protein